jgi:hypothetical protein
MNQPAITITLGQDRRFKADNTFTEFGFKPDSDGHLSITELPHLLDQLTSQQIRCQIQRQIGPPLGGFPAQGTRQSPKFGQHFYFGQQDQHTNGVLMTKQKKTILGLLDLWAELNPNRPALVCCSNNTTCARLHMRAELAKNLSQRVTKDAMEVIKYQSNKIAFVNYDIFANIAANPDLNATLFVDSAKTALLHRVQVELFLRCDLPRFSIVNDFLNLLKTDVQRLAQLFGAPVYADHLVPADVIKTSVISGPDLKTYQRPKSDSLPVAAKNYATHLQQTIWQNDKRNEFVVRLARLLLDRDVAGFASQQGEELSSTVSDAIQASQGRVVVLVENELHRAELAKTTVRKADHNKVSIANSRAEKQDSDGNDKKQFDVITHKETAKKALNIDVLIRADGRQQPFPVELVGLPWTRKTVIDLNIK